MGVRCRWIVGLPRVGPIGFEPTFAVLEIQQEHDGSEERFVHRDASGESIGGIRVAFPFGLKNRSRLPFGWVGGEIRIHARTWDPSS